MQITGIQTQGNNNMGVNKQQSEDSVIKNAQSQIEELRKQLWQLAENKDMDPKAKTEKKQQLQQQIADLNAQIRQRQAELRKEKQSPKESAQKAAEKEAASDAAKKADGFDTGFSKATAGAIISASNSLDFADSMNEVSVKLNGRARELSAEIETDAKRGADTTAKQAELDKVNNGVKNSKAAAADALNEADGKLKNAAETDETLGEIKEKDENNGEEEDIRTDGMYDKNGNRIEEKDESAEREYEDKA